MKLNGCCKSSCSSCANCSIYKILSSDTVTKKKISEEKNCVYAIIAYARKLKDELLFAPNGARDEKAAHLIIHAITQIAYYDAEDCNYIDACAAYCNARFQTYHIEGYYELVIKEYNELQGVFDRTSSMQQEMISHVSSSAFLINNKHQRIKSREMAEHLYEIIRKRYEINKKLETADYYILAKFLEHHIQENKIQEGLKRMEVFLETMQLDSIETGKEALYKVIFYRDMFEALGKEESDDCEWYYNKALEISEDYGITDSRSKLNKKRIEVEEYRRKHYVDFYPNNIQNIIYTGEGSRVSINNGKQKEIHNSYDYTAKDAQKVLDKILEVQDERFENLVNAFVNQMTITQGELKEIGEYLKSGVGKTKKKSMLLELKDYMNETVETVENMNKIYKFFATSLLTLMEQMPQLEELVRKILEKM